MIRHVCLVAVWFFVGTQVGNMVRDPRPWDVAMLLVMLLFAVALTTVHHLLEVPNDFH